MRQIIAKRANLSLFDEDALVELIDKTGGYIRDLFRCISNAAIRAQRRGSSSISIEDVAVVLNELESDINSRYSDADIPELYLPQRALQIFYRFAPCWNITGNAGAICIRWWNSG